VITATAIACPTSFQCVLDYLALLSQPLQSVIKYISDRDVDSIRDGDADVY
jgi:hypothetical protein